MSDKQAGKKVRGTGLPLPEWWLREINLRSQGASLSQLATQLSSLANREQEWRREVVGDFLRGEFTTWEMMLAFSELYGVPPAAFIAQSYAEADEMRAAARRHASPEIAARRQEFDKAKQALTDRLKRQTALLESKDGEGTRSRRRPRGVGSRGSSSS